MVELSELKEYLARGRQGIDFEAGSIEEVGRMIDAAFEELSRGDLDGAINSLEQTQSRVQHIDGIEQNQRRIVQEADEVEQKISREERLTRITSIAIKIPRLMNLIQITEKDAPNNKVRDERLKHLFEMIIKNGGKIVYHEHQDEVVDYMDEHVKLSKFPYYVLLHERNLEEAMALGHMLGLKILTLAGLISIFNDYKNFKAFPRGLIGIDVLYSHLKFKILAIDNGTITLQDISTGKTIGPVKIDEAELRRELESIINLTEGILPEDLAKFINLNKGNSNLVSEHIVGLHIRGTNIQVIKYLEYKGNAFIKLSNLPPTVFVDGENREQIDEAVKLRDRLSDRLKQEETLARLEETLARINRNLYFLTREQKENSTDLENLWTFYKELGLHNENEGRKIVDVIERIKTLKLVVVKR